MVSKRSYVFGDGRRRAVMNEIPESVERVHSEAPAEGDETADPTDIRVHSQDPAEGADTDSGETGQ
jgi:hypothetical protein